MKTRDLIVVSVVVVLLVSPAVAVLMSDDGDGADNTFTHFYKDQLTSNEKIIYEALEKLDPATVEKTSVYGSTAPDWVVKVVVPADYVLSAGDKDKLKELVINDMVRAWQATMLDSPMAWWTWNTDNAFAALYEKTFTLGDVSSVAGFSFYVLIGEDLAAGDGKTVAEKVTQVNDALNELKNSGKIKGDNALDIVRSINSYLTSSDFVYDSEAAFQGNVYGALVHAVDGKHRIACMGFSQMFRLLCDNYNIPCTVIVGLAAQTGSQGGHMWNAVSVPIGGSPVTLAVDSTFDKTGKSSEAFLLNGLMTVVDGNTFLQTHQAFAPIGSGEWENYDFIAPHIADEGYSFPSNNNSIIQMLKEYSPVIITGLICLILVFVLVTTARKGE